MESIQCKLIPNERRTVNAEVSAPLKFTDLEISPHPLQEGVNYVITCWDTNCYVTAKADNRFEIKELHGTELMLDKEMLWIRPCY